MFYVGGAALCNEEWVRVWVQQEVCLHTCQHVDVLKTVCMWSVCEWRGRCVGLTGLWAGHTAGSCGFTRQSQAVLWLVPLPRTRGPYSPSWGSDVRARLLLPGIPGLGAQRYLLFAVCSLLVCLVSFLISMGCPRARPVWGLRLGPLPACVCSYTL